MAAETTSRRPTAADIARSLGISRATVGFVLNDTPGQTISEGTRSRVLAEAARLGYRPHTAAQALASGRSRIVLLVLPDWPMEYILRGYIEETSQVLDEAGYSLVTYTRHESGRARPLWESLNPDVVIGLFPFDAETVSSIRAAGIRRIFPHPEDEASSQESPGVEEGPRMQIAHLAGLGHTRIAFASTADSRIASLVDARRRAAEAATADHGVTLVDSRSVDGNADNPGKILHEWMAAGVTAVAAYNDDVAARVAGAAIRAGHSIPDDVAIIGHDDTPLAALFVPSLSSVRIDFAGLGRLVAELALHEVDGRSVTQDSSASTATLVPRESTVPTSRPIL